MPHGPCNSESPYIFTYYNCVPHSRHSEKISLVRQIFFSVLFHLKITVYFEDARRERDRDRIRPFSAFEKLLACYMRTSIAPPYFLSSRRVREIECKYANTVRCPFPFLLSLGGNSHLQFGHSLLEIVASKSLSTLSNRGTRMAQERDVVTTVGDVGKSRSALAQEQNGPLHRR